MLLQCTKKLLDYAKKTPAENPELRGGLFEWSASLVTLERHKVIVVANVASRTSFVLYGITAKDLKDLDRLIIEGLRKMLKSEHIRDDIIDKYITDLGEDIVYCKNLSRSATARCTSCAEDALFTIYRHNLDDMFQVNLLRRINHHMYQESGKPNDYRLAYKTLHELIKAEYGEDIFVCEVLELDVKLEGTDCRRVLSVPSDINFRNLHEILQKAFGWNDSHMHQFILEADEDGVATKVIEPAGFDDDIDFGSFGIELKIEKLDSDTTTLGEIFKNYKRIVYEYDFGDDWLHDITLKKVRTESDDSFPRCLKAVGEAPVDDCGGVSGFEDLKRILADPNDSEYEATVEWLGAKELKKPDIEKINWMISNFGRI